MWLLNTPAGSFVVQSFFHSLVAILIIERAIQIWNITAPRDQFRYRIVTLVLPVAMIPVYSLIDKGRGSLRTTEQFELLNVTRWLSLDLWDVLPLRLFFFAILGITTAVFLIQEAIPILRDLRARSRGPLPELLPVPDCVRRVTEQLSRTLGITPPPLHIVSDDNPYIFASGARSQAVVVSTGLVENLDPAQIEAALAHELAHIARRSNIMNWVIFLVRMLMFYNPIVLLVFRRIVQDDEHICDDITVSLTRSPENLARILRFFAEPAAEVRPPVPGGVSAVRERISDYGHSLLLKERISRLEKFHELTNEPFSIARFGATVSAIVVLNYFVV